MMTELEDKQLTCKTCAVPFTWNAAEQKFYAEKALTNAPAHCRPCRVARKTAADAAAGKHPKDGRYQAVCKDCNRPTTVPFVPKPGLPSYCPACYRVRKPKAPATAAPTTPDATAPSA